MKLTKTQLILIVILLIALGLRLAHWLDVRNDPFFAQLIMDSQEYDRWAQEIASGHWIGHEVFFQAPLYPYLLALGYVIFGHNLDIIYLIQILLSIAAIYALFRTGTKLGGERLGLWASALSALYGVYIFFDVQILKESMAVSLVCFLLWVFVEAREKDNAGLWMLAGVLGGLLSLLRENMLLVFPFLIILVYKKGAQKKRMLLNASSLMLGLILILTPIAFRNWKVGQVFAPTTFQGGVNFYIGNNPDANGTYRSIVPGKQIPWYERNEPVRIAVQETGRTLNSGEVSQFWMNKALQWIKGHPIDFARLQVKKFLMFWSWYEWPDAVDYYYVRGTSFILKFPLIQFGSLFILAFIGVALNRKKMAGFFPPAVFLFAWMVSTIVFFLFSRYRLPALPALVLFAALGLCSGMERWPSLKLWQRGGMLFLLAVILAAPHLFSFGPRMDVVHYNLALVYDGKGDLEKAEKNYRAALSVNPDDFMSCVNLGNIAVRGNDWATALDWYLKAVDIEPDSDGVHSNLGGAYVALGRLNEAEYHFDRSLSINPSNMLALHNKAILLANKGRFEEAKKMNQEVLKKYPGWQPALNFQKRLSGFIK